MHHLKINNLLEALEDKGMNLEREFVFPADKNVLDQKAYQLLGEVYGLLGGVDSPVYLSKLKFDFKIDRFLFLYDGETHFNR